MSMTSAQARQLGELIKKARVRKKLSLMEVALRLGVSKAWVAKLEAGQMADPGTDRLAVIAAELDIDTRRIDRLTQGALTASLPDMSTYFRAKYALTPEQVADLQRYVERLRRAA